MLCQLSNPPLSSVEQGARRIGFQAAALLDRLMAGRRPRRRKYVVPPEGIVVRRSSDVIAVEDEDIAAALALIQARACGGIKVQDVARAAALSRSQLDRRFKTVVGRTIHDEIRRVRLEQAQRLLAGTSLPLKQIALRCGFRTVQHLTELFHEFMGVAPGRRARAARHCPSPKLVRGEAERPAQVDEEGTKKPGTGADIGRLASTIATRSTSDRIFSPSCQSPSWAWRTTGAAS